LTASLWAAYHDQESTETAADSTVSADDKDTVRGL
jgi:hypothetical protein